MYLRFVRCGLLAGALLFSGMAYSQSGEPATLAPAPAANQKSLLDLANAYSASPGNPDVYSDYLEALLAAKNYKEAERLIGTQQHYTNTPAISIDLGRTYAAQGKDKKAEEAYEQALTAINGDDVVTGQLAKAFAQAGRDDYAIKAYERHRALLQNNYLYSGPLARLYSKTGATDKAVEALLDGAPYQQGGMDEVKANLLEVLGNDPKKLQAAQKAIIRRVNAQPENVFYADILTWLYTQKGDWDGALLQMMAIDERNREAGNRLIQFAALAATQHQYEVALKSIDAVIEKGKESPLYPVARESRLQVALQQIEESPTFNQEQVGRLSRDYDSFFVAFPDYLARPVLNDAALLEAQYNNNPQKAVRLLKEALKHAPADPAQAGRTRLQLGDYQILTGDVWEASLTYSQVDKAFREDMLGEEARFRNAKLAYYRGDFEWAQGQLSVLKASTSELIANDALALSVLITENTPDSNYAPLRAYARADLLLFQNKTADAVRLIDSIAAAYPKHSLNDDLLMLRAGIAMKRRDYPAALGYYAAVIKDYGKDVLADDALFKTAELYERYLQKPEEAKKSYEDLILNYPGSTYVQEARERLAKLNEATPGA